MTAPNNKEAKEQAIYAEEIKEWRDNLMNARSIAAQRDVVTSIIKAMSTGRDVSPLFVDMLKLMSAKDLKLKKLIYIFLTSNSTTGKEQALLCVSALEADAADQDSPIIRATSVRTMGSVATADTAEYYCGAVAKCIKDNDPFVRKCAATCAAKLFKVNRQAVVDAQLIEQVRGLLADGNQAVVSAAAAALISVASNLTSSEIVTYLQCESEQIIFSQHDVQQLMTVLSQATEWSALSLLQAVSKYGALPSPDDAPVCIQRLQPFLRHSNASVSLNTINVVIRYCKAGILPEQDVLTLQQDCIAAIVSLISQNTDPEIQWITFRSLRLIAKAFIGPNPFEQVQKHIRLLFVRFNDELYVKLEKVETLGLICNKETAFDVVKELTDYCEDVQPKFVRASIKAIGMIACRIPEVADACVKAYMDLLNGDETGEKKSTFRLPSYAAQELMVAIQDIFRTYPDRYEGVIGALCEAITTYDDPNAKASLIWILGEYCTRIEGVEDILIDLMDFNMENQTLGTFMEDPVVIQQSLVTAVSKIFASNPTQATQALFNLALTKASQSCLSPDIRMRAGFYLRLIQMDPSLKMAQSVILVQKPSPVYGDGLSVKLGEQLSQQLGSVQATLREIVVVKKEQETDDGEDIVKQFGGFEYEEIIPQQTMEIKLQQNTSAPQQQIMQQTVTAQVVKPQEEDIFGDLLGPSKPTQPVQPMANVQPVHVQQPAQVQERKIAPPVNKVVDPLDDLLGLGALSQPANQGGSQPAPMQQQTHNAVPVDQQYKFPTSQLCPIKMKDPNQSLKVQVCFSRQSYTPIMLIQIKNDASYPYMNTQINFAPNAFGLQVVNKALPIIPALGMMDGGNYYSVPLKITQDLCGFPPQKLGTPDPQMQLSFNLLSFSITVPNSPPLQYQTKVPINCVFPETSLYHSENRQLFDAMRAVQFYRQNWGQYGEYQTQIQISYQQAGGQNYGDAIQGITNKMLCSNFNYVDLQGDHCDFLCSVQVTVGQVKNAICLIKLNYQQIQGGVAVQVVVKAPQDVQVITSYVGALIAVALQQV